jgi:hypothetical protein
MKTFKAMCATLVFALSLSVPAFSEGTAPGDGHSPGNPVPASSPVAVRTATELAAADSNNRLGIFSDLYWVLVSIY